jgi:nucleoside-diphosphate-sugar epimerase
MVKILVTGGAGNIGSALVSRLLSYTEYLVVAVDNLSTGSRHKLPPGTPDNFVFINADVNNFYEISAVMTSYRFDYVFHYSAVVGVKRTLENPVLVLHDIQGSKNISIRPAQHVVSIFHRKSSSGVSFSSFRRGDRGIENSAELTAFVLKSAELICRQQTSDDYEFEPAFSFDDFL